MHMVFIFYGIFGLGSIIFSYWYMKRYWTDEKLQRLEQAETTSDKDLQKLRDANEY